MVYWQHLDNNENEMFIIMVLSYSPLLENAPHIGTHY
jgi:hypothetical protein